MTSLKKCGVCALIVLAISLMSLSSAQVWGAEEVSPNLIASDGLVFFGIQSIPYWAKNNSLNAPSAEMGEMFIFKAFPPRDDEGNYKSCRVAIYAYAQGENDSKPKPIPVRSDIDTEKRYSSKRAGSGLMVSSQVVDDASSVSLFLPHAVYDLPHGMYNISFRVAAFLDDAGKVTTEEYQLSCGLNVEVTRDQGETRRLLRSAKAPTRIVSQDMYETTDELACIIAEKYTLGKVEK